MVWSYASTELSQCLKNPSFWLGINIYTYSEHRIPNQPHPSSEKILPIGRRPDPGTNNSQKMKLPIGPEPVQSIRRHDKFFLGDFSRLSWAKETEDLPAREDKEWQRINTNAFKLFSTQHEMNHTFKFSTRLRLKFNVIRALQKNRE